MSYMKTARRKKDIGINGRMAKWYDKNTRSSRLSEMREYADMVNGYADRGAAVLEVAPGPGYLAIELAKRGFSVTGVEISADFVEIEKHNAREAGVNVDFRQGNASALPLPDSAFDFIICSAAFKTFLKNGAYTREGFEELISQTDFGHHKILKQGIGFQVWMYKLGMQI
ncbi:class I SAM-dependent methyltransferase [Ruminiclostridium cellobioparum]|uniref:Methyltransferase n=1 Tax=Ruminiclostridium cellobioparum subsp. termitidis CT1112 TaxID=1195236 RepID=S0FU42_RUMCE|nr:class I SAM-dependent methyltransferase [Ruminiclostridium cellobioparum]EMS72704.1 Methyltransferase [Ruminiclostridium cellobioparum subsp. termitidis CT1112]